MLTTSTWQQRPAQSQEILPDLKTFSRAPSWVLEYLQRYTTISTESALLQWLEPTMADFPDPFVLHGIKDAAARISTAINQSQQIAIYGDYDVDGTSATALLKRFFEQLGVQVIAYQPDRFTEGYGLNLGAVEKLHQQGTKVIITVDCGITAFHEVERAIELGIDVIITDHHQVQNTPPAGIVINPNSPACKSGYNDLCGTGVAFFLALAVRAELRQNGFFTNKTVPDLREHLDLVALATVADVVPLGKTNRILLKLGIPMLTKTKKPGLRSLIQHAGISGDITPYHIGFAIAPRINAAGRFSKIYEALELLSTNDSMRAYELAGKLESYNRERMVIQNAMVEEALHQARREQANANVIVVMNPHWHEGIVGIVANRIVDEMGRPAIVLTESHGKLKGSARSVIGVSIFDILKKHSHHLEKWGGHPMAAGLTLAPEQFEAFRKDASETPIEIEKASEYFDFSFLASNLSQADFAWITKLRPFGPGTPEPTFLLQNLQIKHVQILKEKHLKLQVKVDQMGTLSAVSWNMASRIDEISAGLIVDALTTLEISGFSGKPELKIRNFRPSVGK